VSGREAEKMRELTAIRAMLDHETFLKFNGTLKALDRLEPEQRHIIETIGAYYDQYRDANAISLDELVMFFESENPTLRDRPVYQNMFQKMSEISMENPELMVDILNSIATKHYFTKIMHAAMDGAQGAAKDLSEIEELLMEHRDFIGGVRDSEAEVCVTPLAELLKSSAEGGLMWRNAWLNEWLGPLKNRTLGHVFARPDVGKTAFAIFHGLGFAYSLQKEGRPVLFLNNEEDIERIRLRAYSSLLRKSEAELAEDPVNAELMWKQSGGENFKMIGGVTQLDQILRFIRAFNPGVVIIDQGPKVEMTQKTDTDPKRLQILYNRYREMAKDYDCRVIALGQADSTAEGKEILTKNNLDGSKVGIPGECDWILGIGMRNEPERFNQRYYKICKNKLTGSYRGIRLFFNADKCEFVGKDDVRRDSERKEGL
jgi:hypothetical protein